VLKLRHDQRFAHCLAFQLLRRFGQSPRHQLPRGGARLLGGNRIQILEH
jgi:hypothetical protein